MTFGNSSALFAPPNGSSSNIPDVQTTRRIHDPYYAANLGVLSGMEFKEGDQVCHCVPLSLQSRADTPMAEAA